MGRKLLILNERDLKHPWAGGAELHIHQMARCFVAAGYRPVLLCTKHPRGAAEEVNEHGLRIRRFGNRLTYYLWLPSMVREEAQTPGTVILEHLNKIPFCTPLYTRAPVVLVTHHLFGSTAFSQAPFPVAALVYASERLIPYVYRNRPFIAVSPSTRDDLIRRGIPAARIRVIPNGLDHSLYGSAGRQPSECPTILVLGRVEFYKRIDFVLEALVQVRRHLPAARVLVVGEGRARDRLEKLRDQLGLHGAVEFTGFVPDGEKVALIRSAHVVANTSEKEGWGLTVLEANACGVPAVASDVPGLRDAVRHGETGLLVPHGNVEELARALLEVLQNHDLRERLGRGAVAWAQSFSWEKAAEETLSLVESAARQAS